MMEYQIVPTCKHVGQMKTKKHHSEDYCKKCEKVRHTDDINVFILQPMLKLPKSTREVKNAEDETSIVVSAVKDSNKCNNNNNNNNNKNNNNTFNHFTMSRKGLVKGVVSTTANNMSRVEDPWGHISPQLLPENRSSSSDKPRLITIPVGYEDYSAHRRRPSEVPTKFTRDRMRRASAGDALLKSNRFSGTKSDQKSPRVLTLGPDEVLLIPQSKQPYSKTHQQQDNGHQNGHSVHSTSKPDTQRDDRLKPPPDCLVPRRKSFHDWCSMRQWYCPEELPVSCERRQSERRNVISPNTLSRIVPSERKTDGIRQKSAAISVCTEGDMMRYNFNLPSRRLVSHKELKSCSLPYNDNIGLEETVSSDQARKGAKLKMSLSMAVRNKYENSKQTPKQVWYRTIRSILAANHLYHHVKNKKLAA